jgi:hypothetical protein
MLTALTFFDILVKMTGWKRSLIKMKIPGRR